MRAGSEGQGLPTRDTPRRSPTAGRCHSRPSGCRAQAHQAAAHVEKQGRRGPGKPPAAARLRNPFASIPFHCSAVCYFLGGERCLWVGAGVGGTLPGP